MKILQLVTASVAETTSSLTRSAADLTEAALDAALEIANALADECFQRRLRKELPTWEALAITDVTVLESLLEHLERGHAAGTTPDPVRLADSYAFTTALARHRHHQEVTATLAAGRMPAALTWEELPLGHDARYYTEARNWLLSLPAATSQLPRTA